MRHFFVSVMICYENELRKTDYSSGVIHSEKYPRLYEIVQGLTKGRPPCSVIPMNIIEVSEDDAIEYGEKPPPVQATGGVGTVTVKTDDD